MKCNKCKCEIENPMSELVRVGNINYHIQCLKDKLTQTKRKPITLAEAENYIDELRKELVPKMMLQQKKDELYHFVMEKYEIVKMTTRYFQTIDNFIKLKYDLGIIKQMLERENFQKTLEQAHKKRFATSKEELIGESKWNYDVVLINKYYHKFVAYLESLKFSNNLSHNVKGELKVLEQIKQQQAKMREQGFVNKYQKYLFED